MAVKQSAAETSGALTIGFSAVVREALQSIMVKDRSLEIIVDAKERGGEALK